MLSLMLFTNIDHILWLNSNDTNQPLTTGLFPLLINNIVWISIIPIFLIWKTQKTISKFTFLTLIITTIAQLSTTIYARIIDDPQAAGLPFVIITIPISIVLLIFTIKELKT